MSVTSEQVVVTGAAGFIGSHLVEELIRRGNRVRAVVRYTSRGDIGNLNWIDPSLLREVEIVRGDIRDSEFVCRTVKGAATIYHLAAGISIPYSYTNFREVVETNINGTLNILSGAKDSTALRRIVTTSTSEVFGTAQYVPMGEEHPLCPQSPYAATKVGSDKLAESFGYSFNMPIVIARPFNTFGPRQSPRAVIPTIILQALSSDSIYLGQVESTSDFLYVADTVKAFIACGDAGAEINGQYFNFGTGVEIKINDLKDKILNIIGQYAEVEIEKRRLRPKTSEVMRLLCDSSKAYKLLNWSPCVTIEEGLKRTISWFSDNKKYFDRENNLI